MTGPRVSVVIVTQERAEVLAECLDHLDRQDTALMEAVVVDSSSRADASVAAAFRYPWARCVHLGPVHQNMQLARNVGIVLARGSILAFLDDDCFVRGCWLAELLRLIDRPGVGAVGGRVVDRRWEHHTPPIARAGSVGVVTPNGRVVSGFFGLADEPVPVQHLPGGNAAVRREVAEALDGFDTRYRGTNFREDTDFYYRVHASGHALLFSSAMEVYHLAASKSGHGFTSRDGMAVRYWEGRNHAQFLRHCVGLGLGAVLKYFLPTLAIDVASARPNRIASGLRQLQGTLRGLGPVPTQQSGRLAEAARIATRLAGT